ncbi:hypothetical protein [Streptomyces sp. Ru73]|uniref:hypothetical protein n=1 Tax=Streptomyces sp. Ru73 TaxID=2080748 RepID=UPI0015E3A629|nr:hypothetical protein [Streptomyces sp. Ru73]
MREPGDREVRALGQQGEVTWAGDTPRRAVSLPYGRGPAKTVSRHRTIGRGTAG